MEDLVLKSVVKVAQLDELSEAERHLVALAIEGTNRSYAPYSRFHVGAAIQLKDGTTVIGCNQENAAFPSGICAERSAIFAAGAQHPDQPVMMMAIAARNEKRSLFRHVVLVVRYSLRRRHVSNNLCVSYYMVSVMYMLLMVSNS